MQCLFFASVPEESLPGLDSSPNNVWPKFRVVKLPSDGHWWMFPHTVLSTACSSLKLSCTSLFMNPIDSSYWCWISQLVHSRTVEASCLLTGQLPRITPFPGKTTDPTHTFLTSVPSGLPSSCLTVIVLDVAQEGPSQNCGLVGCYNARARTHCLVSWLADRHAAKRLCFKDLFYVTDTLGHIRLGSTLVTKGPSFTDLIWPISDLVGVDRTTMLDLWCARPQVLTANLQIRTS